MPRTTAARCLLAMVALSAALVGAIPRTSGAAFPMHLRLVKSEPARNDTTKSPHAIRLWFSESAVLSVTSISLTNAAGDIVQLSKPVFKGNPEEPVEATLGAPLSSGSYTVRYKTASRDMHPVSGSYMFVVR